MKNVPRLKAGLVGFVFGAVAAATSVWSWFAWRTASVQNGPPRPGLPIDASSTDTELTVKALVFHPFSGQIDLGRGVPKAPPVEGERRKLMELFRKHKVHAEKYAAQLLASNASPEAIFYALQILNYIESPAGLSVAKSRLSRISDVSLGYSQSELLSLESYLTHYIDSCKHFDG